MAGIEATEYRERQDRARRAAEERGLSALVVFSRGGGSHDRIADVLGSGRARDLTALRRRPPFRPLAGGGPRGRGGAGRRADDGDRGRRRAPDRAGRRPDRRVRRTPLCRGGVPALGTGSTSWVATSSRRTGGTSWPNAAARSLQPLTISARRCDDAESVGAATAACRSAGSAPRRWRGARGGDSGAREADVAATLIERVVREGGAGLRRCRLRR